MLTEQDDQIHEITCKAVAAAITLWRVATITIAEEQTLEV